MSRVSASYKKQDGLLSINSDRLTVHWAPAAPPGTPPTLTIAVSDITNLQQTPATSAKVSIKIVATDNYVFAFSSPTARDDQAAITNTLRQAIEAHKARGQPPPATSATNTPTPNADGQAQSAAMTFAKAASGASGAAAKPEDELFNDARLLADVDLQRSLLSKDLATRKRFDEALRGKPESISVGMFSQQFWSTRVHLLRAHAVELSQHHGPYNALSAIKFKYDDEGKPTTILTRGQIATIFSQHPLVRRAYNDLVPPMKDTEFFSSFFASRLYKRLKGEKITDMDPMNPKLDKYLDDSEENERAKGLNVEHFPHFLDIEGNEQNHSQRRGNRPDMTMRPSGYDKVPILKSLNRVSEHMMADVLPADVYDPHAPVGVDEITFEQLRLQDLQRNNEDNRIMLNIRDQQQFFSRDVQASTEAKVYAKQSPKDVISTLKNELQPGGAQGLNLPAAIGVDDNSDSEEDARATKAGKVRIGTKASRNSATRQILNAVKQRWAQTNDFSTPLGTFAPVSSVSNSTGLSSNAVDGLTLAHNTTIEFLHYFYAVYHSGDAERAGELGTLAETLDKSLERLNAIAADAEAERAALVADARRRNDEYTARTGKRRRFDESAIKGGREGVLAVVKPTVRAVTEATSRYRRELAAQLAAVQQQQQQQQQAAMAGAGTPVAA
ncbi:uncharacterized protein K452DRAFT_293728 [Aplosporella prunicola CBS 121167]|uniref:BSD domain-containing protein n=1 Tax=Aplosporella prunicola CBS 121167 TaxID=1176127 RepID=A0A6A6BWK0_9PEZI|nr:uncharacterized protein K452DRAFT_293728 [Aplosporella prunicola CBS 121167]KAF2147277.1 hypothetical protein K452DRAFT_293728 [Aplosporella prunicola CBS 121167]